MPCLALTVRLDSIADANPAVHDDVRSQSPAMNERPKQARSGESLKVSARFAQPSPDALGGADAESPADQAVEGDAARDDVAARLLPGELDLVEHLCLDESELVTATGSAERALAGRVAVALEPPARDCDDLVD